MITDKKAENLSDALLELSKKGNVSGHEIVETIRVYFNVESSILYKLLSKKAIKEKKIAKSIEDYEFQIIPYAVDDKYKVSSLIEAPEMRDEFVLLASYPEKTDSKDTKYIEEIYPRICRLIMAAKKELILINPYFDRIGVKKIMPFMVEASKRGVAIKIVARKMGSQEFISSIGKNAKNKVDVKYFGGEGYYLHAKCIIADSELAYIGSANITGTSLGSNLELGILFSGEKVKTLHSFVEKMLALEDD